MKTPLKLLTFPLLSALLVACGQPSLKDSGSRFYRVQEGSRITLNQPLEVPAGKTRVFLQRGAVTPFSDLDQYTPSCSFVVWDLRQEPQTIKPDSFSVQRVSLGETEIVSVPGERRLAGLLPLSAWDGGEPLVARYYDHWLASDNQPNVTRLRCYGAMGDLSEAQLPLFIEMEGALGEMATLEH
ncbi:MAG: hypothetical protein OQL28_14780 [Sedimenticola sp.]|nr:hypothetical protein [Sedimenticola sp.]